MKYVKIFMMLAVASLFVACNDDDKWGDPSQAVVKLGQTELRLKENKGLAYIPVEVVGENHGRIKVTIDVAAAETDGAEEDVNYIITSKTIVIPADANEGAIEFRPVDDDVINADRKFTVTIASVNGATVEEGTATEVVLRDNDAEFYDKIAGTWSMNYTNAQSGATGTWNVTVIGADDEDDPDYNHYLYVTGMMGYSWTVAVLTYEYDQATNTVSLKFEMPQLFAEDVNFGLPGYDSNNVVLYSYTQNGWDTQEIVAEVSDDFKTITFAESNPPMIAAITDPSNNERTGYYWFYNYIDSMTR